MPQFPNIPAALDALKKQPAAKAAPIKERDEVRAAQNALYTNYGLAADLGPTGVDGKLGDKTRAALKKAKPGMNVEQAITALSEEWNKKSPATPEVPPNPYVANNNRTWGVDPQATSATPAAPEQRSPNKNDPGY
jgi:hypothetical protein